jgi:hypothetical protein
VNAVLERHIGETLEPPPVLAQVIPIPPFSIQLLMPDIRKLILIKLEHLLKGIKIARQGSSKFMQQDAISHGDP